MNGVAGIIVFSAPSAVSAAWFPPEERTTATGVAIIFNNLGNALSFLAAPAIVPDPHQINGSSSNVGDVLFHYMAVPGDWKKNGSHCPDVDPEEKKLISSRVADLMYLGLVRSVKVSLLRSLSLFLVVAEFGLIAACFLAIVIYFPSKPKIPPSISSSVERMDFVPGLWKICR